MIWLTWRQFRPQAVIAVAALAAFAVLLALTGPHLAGLYASSTIGSCQSSDCSGPATDFLSQLNATATYGLLDLLGIVIILIAPGVIGMFWGAPLIARELEANTHYLVWNQSITRTRWLVVKLTLIGLAAMAVTEALSVMQAWWAMPISRAVARGGSGTPIALSQFSPLVFASHGITPLGYAAFAFVLGVTAGVLLRRTVPAMALTLAVFAALQIAMPLWIRPHLFPPDYTITTLNSLSPPVPISFDLTNRTFTITAGGLTSQPEAWILSSGAVDASGNPVSTVPEACTHPQPFTGPGAILDCLASNGIREAVTYQPASRYWPIQSIETAIYLALASALAGFCFWRLRRRL